MSHHEDSVYLGHMLDTAREVHEMTLNVNRTEFFADRKLRLAVIHLVQVVGEAATRVSAETRQAHPEILWGKIAATRHRIVHDYVNVNEKVVWEIATQDIPVLIGALERFIPPDPPPAAGKRP